VPLVPLSPVTHARAKLRPLKSLAFASRSAAVPLYISDLAPLCHELPIVFLRDGVTMTLAALTALQSDTNLMLDAQGRWTGSHVPGAWRCIPFRLARVESDPANLLLCIDDSYGLINEAEGTALFNADGTPSSLVDSVKAILSQYETEAATARAICAELSRLDLLIPWAIEVAHPDGAKRTLSGLFRVDETKIRALPADDLVRLRDLGGLGLIYTHLLSLSRINALSRIAQREADRNRQREATRSGTLDLDRAFGIVEDDPFIF